MIRKVSVFVVLFLFIFVLMSPVIAAGGNGGSSGSDGAGSGGSDAGGNDDGSSGNAGDGAGSPGTGDQQAQVLREEQERREQATVEQPGVQITQQDRDQTQGRTGVDTTVETASMDSIRQRDRDNFLQQISQLQQNLSQDQDQDQVHLALSAFSLAGNVTGSSGPELARMGAEVNNSLAAAYQAEQQIHSRSSFMRMLFGGDREAAGLLIQNADQNQQRIQQMEQLLADCSDCDPQVRVMLEEQVQVLTQEQNRLLTFGLQEQGNRGLFGWMFGGSGVLGGTTQAAVLTDDEKSWLTYMREEEKLARDVYLSLGGRWNLPVFANIAKSEQVHMDSIKTLLDRYGIPDPAAGKAQGEFSNQDLQKLHDELITKGSVSPIEALKTGIFIEETDIADLNKAFATTTHNDIKTVYNNLLQGSMNHLNAFESNLARY